MWWQSCALCSCIHSMFLRKWLVWGICHAVQHFLMRETKCFVFESWDFLNNEQLWMHYILASHSIWFIIMQAFLQWIYLSSNRNNKLNNIHWITNAFVTKQTKINTYNITLTTLTAGAYYHPFPHMAIVSDFSKKNLVVQ